VGAAEALGGLEQDRLGDAVGIFADLAVPEADHGPAPLFKEASACQIIFAVNVLTAVNFDDQPRLATGKVSDVGVDG
jgi:hypothetical protein